MSQKNTHKRSARRKAFAKRESIMRKAITSAIAELCDLNNTMETKINKAGTILVDAMNAEKAVEIPHSPAPEETI